MCFVQADFSMSLSRTMVAAHLSVSQAMDEAKPMAD